MTNNKYTQRGVVALVAALQLLLTALIAALSRFIFVDNMFEQEYFSDRVLNIFYMVLFLLIWNSLIFAIDKNNKYAKEDFLLKSKDNKITSHIKLILSSFDFYIEIITVTALSVLLPDTFLYGFIGKIFFTDEKLITLVIMLPIMIALLFVARIIIQKNWYARAKNNVQDSAKGKKEKAPLVVFQHGGGGTPELASDFYGKNNYNHGVRRVVNRGVAVLLPQLLIWSQEESETQRAHPIDYNRDELDKDLKRFGMSVTGFEIAAIMRCIDYAVTLPEIDGERIGMTGLSYGGYFTLYTMAADTRIKAGYAVGAFNDRDSYPRFDWTYFGGSLRFHDAEVAALCAPRRLAIQIGKADSVFNYETGLMEMERIRDYFSAYGATDGLKLSVWDGGHTYSDDDECFDFFFDSI